MLLSILPRELDCRSNFFTLVIGFISVGGNQHHRDPRLPLRLADSIPIVTG
jgi:hypothetical protein